MDPATLTKFFTVGLTHCFCKKRLTLNSDEATLTEEQIEAAVKAVVDQLVAAVAARQRV